MKLAELFALFPVRLPCSVLEFLDKILIIAMQFTNAIGGVSGSLVYYLLSYVRVRYLCSLLPGARPRQTREHTHRYIYRYLLNQKPINLQLSLPRGIPSLFPAVSFPLPGPQSQSRRYDHPDTPV